MTEPRKSRSGTNIHSSERGSASILVRLSPELKAEGRAFCDKNGLTWAQLIQAGIAAMDELAR